MPQPNKPLIRHIAHTGELITIQPYEIIQLDLGAFRHGSKHPEFVMESQADLDEVLTYYDCTLPHGEGYRVTRVILSFWDKPVTIRVRLLRHGRLETDVFR